MKNIFLLTFQLFLFTNFSAQINFEDIKYWVGSGPDSATLVIDFQDGSMDPSYVWGYLFDASNVVSAQNMIEDISNDEPTIDIAAGGGFLNDIYYNDHGGTGGAPNFWGTWSYNESIGWELNEGLSESLINGAIFGCSYTDFDPAIEPAEPIAAYSSLWFSEDDIDYWVGEGANDAVLVIDFVDDLNYGIPVRYAWGYHFDGEVDAAQMLTDIGNADENLVVDLSGGFLNDILYIDQEGVAGSPYYWGTFSGTNLSNWSLNSGISETLADGSWFGCTYAEWEPPRPFTPIPAVDADSFAMNDVTTWFGEGADSCVVIIDFNDDGSSTDSYAFGYLFNGITTGEEALNVISSEIEDLDISIAGGFLNDITFSTHNGIGGSPNYWGTWSATNIGSWILNTGISEVINNGDWFGCSYTDFSPALPPNHPNNPILSLSSFTLNKFQVYPNPTSGVLNFNMDSAEDYSLTLLDVNGKLVHAFGDASNMKQINLSAFPKGMYFISVTTGESNSFQKITIK